MFILNSSNKMGFYITVSMFLSFIYVTYTEPQFPEINDQYEQQKHNEAESIKQDTTTITTTSSTDQLPSKINIDEIKVEQEATETVNNEVNNSNPITIRRSFTTKLYESITAPLNNFINAPRVNNVIRNIGTCIVNGVMELIAFYLPAPLIPLIASTAGMFIPFEPVVMLKQKMPVASYRRAFRTAMDSFMGTFDRYKMQDDDPYMTNRFNRRFMGNSKEVKGDKDND